MKNYLWFSKKIVGKIFCVCIIYILFTPCTSLSAEAVPKTFEVAFEQDPYELVMTAEKYRMEFVKDDLEKNFYDTYFDNALKLYDKALFRDPNFGYGYLSYGYLYLLGAEYYNKKKDALYKKAEACFIQSASVRPSYIEPYYYLFQVYTLQEKWDKADEILLKYSNKSQFDSYYYAWLGYRIILENDDNKQAAYKEYKKAIKLNTHPAPFNWANKYINKSWGYIPHPPFPIPTLLKREIHPSSLNMTLEINLFEDQTRKVRNLKKVVPRLLATVLFKRGRFEIVQSNIIKDKQSADLDAVIIGDFVRINTQKKELLLDIKAVNPQTGQVLLAESLSMPYTEKGKEVEVSQKEIEKTADMIEIKLAKMEGRIIRIKGEYITVNMGKQQGIKSGLKAYILDKELRISDPQAMEILNKEIFIGEIIFEVVGDEISEAKLLTKGRISAKIGNIVILK